MALTNKVINGRTVLVDDAGNVVYDPQQPNPKDAIDLFLDKEVIENTGIKVKHALSFGTVVLLLVGGKR